MQTFLFRLKFEGEKLITLGVVIHQNEEENFLNRRVKSELNKMFRDVTGVWREMRYAEELRQSQLGPCS